MKPLFKALHEDSPESSNKEIQQTIEEAQEAMELLMTDFCLEHFEFYFKKEFQEELFLRLYETS